MQVVWFSEIKWDYLRTRKQQLISRRPSAVRLLFLEPYRKGSWNRYRLREEQGIFCATVPFPKAASPSLARSLLEKPWARRVLEGMGRRRVSALMGSLGFRPSEVGFVVSNIYAARAALGMPRKFLVYDCNDDHSSFPGTPGWARDYFERLCREADLVVTSSTSLERKVSALRGDRPTVRVGNGVDYRRFSSLDPLPLERVRLGYIGALAPWVDFSLLEATARAHPEWELLMVGPVLGGVEDELSRLTALPNVHRMVPVAYEKVPSLLAQFTLGLIPFRRNSLTRGVNPNKLYEYMAAGLPVVATPFAPELEEFPEVVGLGASAEQFVAACERAVGLLARGEAARELAAKAREYARAHDWDRIAERFWREVRNLSGEESS